LRQQYPDKKKGAQKIISFVGTPPTTVLYGTSLLTTAPAATTLFSPMVTPGKTVPTHNRLRVPGDDVPVKFRCAQWINTALLPFFTYWWMNVFCSLLTSCVAPLHLPIN